MKEVTIYRQMSKCRRRHAVRNSHHHPSSCEPFIPEFEFLGSFWVVLPNLDTLLAISSGFTRDHRAKTGRPVLLSYCLSHRKIRPQTCGREILSGI